MTISIEDDSLEASAPSTNKRDGPVKTTNGAVSFNEKATGCAGENKTYRQKKSFSCKNKNTLALMRCGTGPGELNGGSGQGLRKRSKESSGFLHGNAARKERPAKRWILPFFFWPCGKST